MGVNVDRGAALLAAIYADPADDAARTVYADYLQDRGDPRGELIALQLANAHPERQAELLKEYTPRWLGAMASQIKRTGLVWERGFVAAGEALHFEDDPDPAWRMVHTLTVEHVQPLTRLKAPLAVERLIYTGGGADSRFAKVTCLPRLKHLELRYGETARDHAPMLKREGLESLHAIGDLAALGEWTKLAIPVISVEERGPHPWSVRMTRTGKKRDLALVAPRLQPSAAWLERQHRPYGEAMLAGLATLPRAAIGAISVEISAAAKGPTEKLIGRQLARLYGDVPWTTMRA